MYRKELAKAKDSIALMKELTKKYRDEIATPYIADEKGFIDEVIDSAYTRVKLIKLLRSLEKKYTALPRRKHGNIPL